MANEKKLFAASDAAPVVLYAKTDAAQDSAIPLLAAPDGSLKQGFSLPVYDYVALTISPSDTETYVYRTGGASGTTVATVVIVYTDATRSDILTVTRT